MENAMFALMSLLSGPAAAFPTTIDTEWGSPTYDYGYLLDARSGLMQCDSDWDDLMHQEHRHISRPGDKPSTTKFEASGNDGVSEYGIGWVYELLMLPPVQVDVYESPSHFALGSGWLISGRTGYEVQVSGQVLDIAPVFLDPSSCTIPTAPEWFIEVTTTSGSFLTALLPS